MTSSTSFKLLKLLCKMQTCTDFTSLLCYPNELEIHHLAMVKRVQPRHGRALIYNCVNGQI